jgi:biotin carboxylase/ribosomal protein S18 acetylase RimI-like enzyme
VDRQVLFVQGAHTCVPSDPLRAARGLGCRTVVLTPAVPACSDDADLMDAVEVTGSRGEGAVVGLALEYHARQPVSAVISYEDGAAVLAARIAEALDLPGHPVEAAIAAVDKPTMKQRFAAAGVPCARYRLADDEDDAVGFASEHGYPVVVKPCRGGASQGVMRANDEVELRACYRRLRRIVRDYGLDTGGRPNRVQLVESYLPGSEISVELIIDRGHAQVSTVFEKPRPLTGPFFEETIYLTPPRLPGQVREAAEVLAARAAAALGLWHGAAHCEIRVTDDGLYVLEVAGRLLGGACARVFRDCLGTDIHPLLLRLAMGERVVLPPRAATARQPVAAALMLPVPGEGKLVALRGTDRARRVPGITDVVEVGCPGDVIVPFPEQACYPVGFIGAAGQTHQAVEDALAWASASITVELAPVGCERWARPLSTADGEAGGLPESAVRLAGLPPERARQLAVAHVAEIMYGELPADEAARSAECTVAREYERGSVAGICLPGRGIMLGFIDGDAGYVCCFGVQPELRHRGVGSMLMTAQLAELARRGAKVAVSETDPRLPLSAMLLRRCGFASEQPQSTHGGRVYSCALDDAGPSKLDERHDEEPGDASCVDARCC